jgi:hypothetical protein
MPKHELKSIVGQKFGRLTVIERAENNKHKHTRWRCMCDCGNEIVAIGQNMKKGSTHSCGCLWKEMLDSKVFLRSGTTHGDSDSRLFSIWRGMRKRCHYEKDISFYNYGGRGIVVCEEWNGKGKYETFKIWALENGYQENLTLDRIDINGNYEPNNCRWATMVEQGANRRTTKRVLCDGKEMTTREASIFTGLSIKTIQRQLRNGLTIEQMIERNIKHRNQYS